MTKRICNICDKEKVGIFEWWFGLRHCEYCDIRMFINKICMYDTDPSIKQQLLKDALKRGKIK